jgi:hypothetical protein
MATNTERIADLEAEIARWRELIEPTAAVIQIVWDAAFDAGRQSITGPRPVAAPRSRPRHLHCMPGGGS